MDGPGEISRNGCAPVDCGPASAAVPLSVADATEWARLFSALADPVRLRLLSLVAAHAELCSCHLEAPLARSQPTVSHHTKILAEAGLIVGEKRGRWVWWHVNPGRMAQVRQILRQSAGGAAEATEPA